MRSAQTLVWFGLGAFLVVLGLTGCGDGSGTKKPIYLDSNVESGGAESGSEDGSLRGSSTTAAFDADGNRLGLVVYTQALYEPTLGVQALAALRREGKTATLFGKVSAQGYPYELSEIAIVGEKSGTTDPEKAIRIFYDNGFPTVVVNEDSGATLFLTWGTASVTLTMNAAAGESSVTVYRTGTRLFVGAPTPFNNFEQGGYTTTLADGSALVLPGPLAEMLGSCDAATATPGAPNSSLEGAWTGVVGRFVQNRADDLSLLACELLARSSDTLAVPNSLTTRILENLGDLGDASLLGALGIAAEAAEIAFQVGKLPRGVYTAEGFGVVTEYAPHDLSPSTVIPTSNAEPPVERFSAYLFNPNGGSDDWSIRQFTGTYTADGDGAVFYDGLGNAITTTHFSGNSATGTLDWLDLPFAATFQNPTECDEDDENACTLDLCVESTWGFHPTVWTDDKNDCTVDSCNQETGAIEHLDECTSCGDEVIVDNGALRFAEAGWEPGDWLSTAEPGDLSVVQTSMGMNIYGFGVQTALNMALADDFTVVNTEGWVLEHATFFGYQTGSTTTSTFTDITVRIWNGSPAGVGISPIHETTGFVSTEWTGIYRVLDTTLGSTERPIMRIDVDLNLTLAPGTYYLSYSLVGNGSSGPWSAPAVLLGDSATGNMLQYSGGGWSAVVDGSPSNGQGMPMILRGHTLCEDE